MTVLTTTLKSIDHGRAVVVSDRSEIARFIGLGAKRRALRYLVRFDPWKEIRDAR